MSISKDEQEFVDMVARFVNERVRPEVRELEAANEYPERWIEEMKEMGVHGLLVPAEHGGVDVSTACFARITEELARGWMSLAGAMGGHSVISYLVRTLGTPEQKATYLPRMATGELRATMALTEPAGGSDLQAMRTIATPSADGTSYTIHGTKTWISNARRSGLIGLLCVTDPMAQPSHAGMSVILVEKVPGVEISNDIPKLGYKGVEACEVAFDGAVVSNDAVLGGCPTPAGGT